MSELDGFELFVPDAGRPLYITTSEKTLRICADAYKALGCPDCVNIFFDEVKRRMMIKSAKKEYENTLNVTAHSSGRNMSICCKSLARKAVEMYGKGVRVYGHVAGDGILIFDRVRE